MIVLTRKEKSDLTRTEEYVRERIDRTLKGIRSRDITFLDEIYHLIDARVETMEYLSSVRVPVIDDYTPVETSLYNDMALDIRELSEINLETIKDLYDTLSTVYDDIYSEGESISESLAMCDNLLTKVETNLKSKISVSSVKDEEDVVALDETISESDETMVPTLPDLTGDIEVSVRAADELIEGISSEPTPIENLINTDASPFVKAGLNIDQNAGFITLSPGKRTKIDYTVSSVTFNKSKGRIKQPAEVVQHRGVNRITISGPSELRNSMNFFTDGYFHTRVLSEEPIFENQYSDSTETLYDGSLKSEYMAEYNTKKAHSMTATFTLDITDARGRARKVDHIVVEASSGDKTSVKSTKFTTPLLVGMKLDQKDVTSDVLNRTIRPPRHFGVPIRGSNTKGFKSVPSTTNSLGSFITPGKTAKEVTMQIRAWYPQVIWYPEKRLFNAAGGIMRTFNYFETLILNDYDPPSGFPNPKDLYTDEEIEALWDAYYSADSDVDLKRYIYRYYLGIKDISVYAMTYDRSGYIISGNLNRHRGKRVASVQLFTNEILPKGTAINYYISHDKNSWFPISPRGKNNPDSHPVRLVYSTLTSRTGDVFIGVNASTVYLKIEMTGNGTTTPILKGYTTRIKYV